MGKGELFQGFRVTWGDYRKHVSIDGWLHNIMNVFTATEFYIYEWLT